MTSPEAWTASGDGTTHKGVNVVSHFATFPPTLSPSELDGGVWQAPRRRFLGVTREVNHKTLTQLDNWIGLITDIKSVYEKSPTGSKEPMKDTEIGRKATGYSADHAADQQKLSKELYAYKQSCSLQFQGAEVMKLKSEGGVGGVVGEEFGGILAEVGDLGGWETRSTEDQEKLLGRLIERVCVHFGKLAFAELPERVQRIFGLWLWSGCCMHKDLNTFKAGAVRLSKFWKGVAGKGPVKLLSRRSEEKEELTGLDARDCELSNTSGGAAKLADLVGALVRNKVETKGYPDEFRTYSKDQLGYEIPFPDTSNTRYQCYGNAATELIRDPDFYIGFLNQHGKKKKRGAGLNHMEKNIVKGLEDPATRTELAVFSLYSEAISKPYAISVRGSLNESKNALDLGPAHLQIIGHIDTLAKNPDLLIGDHTSHETGALYGTRWDQDIINHVHSIRDQLPHLRQALVAFLQGAQAKWVGFTKEFGPGSEISDTTAEERRLSFRSPTNDHSEGAGAMWKQWSRRAPSMTTHQKNARIFIQLNSPDIQMFMHDLPEPDQAFARRKAREMDGAKLPAKECEAQARADCEAVDEEEREAGRWRERWEAKEAEELLMLDGFQPTLSLDKFLAFPENKPSNDELRRQLVWHRRVGGDKTLPSGTFSSTKKPVMKEFVVGALERCEQGDVMDIDMEEQGPTDAEGSKITVNIVDRDGNPNEGTVPAACAWPETIPFHSDWPVSLGPKNPLPTNFGCVWDPIDYSCAYNCVFTAFTWIYLHATDVWQQRWSQELELGDFLSGHFGKILSALSGPTPDCTVPGLFAEGRDAWRDILSQRHPAEFPRRGPEYASVTRILETLADNRNPSHYATITLSCGTAGCPLRTKNLRAKYYMLIADDWNASTGAISLPYHESLETWIMKHYSNSCFTGVADKCMRCHQQLLQKLVFRKSTWIWFEVFLEHRHVVLPALEISLGSASFRLAAVIYLNHNHYRARLCDPSGAWWFYNGQQYRGRPNRLPKVPSEEELFQCGSDFNVTALVYCLAE